jgi:hypothetical protein
LAFAVTLHRRCIVNKEAPARAASQLGLDTEQTQGVARLLRGIKFLPRPERLAVIAMRDPGYTDEDIAEMFGRCEDWAALVRENADAIRASEPIPMELEFLTENDFRDGGYAERHKAAEQTRTPRPGRPAILRTYSWDGRNATFLQAGAE